MRDHRVAQIEMAFGCHFLARDGALLLVLVYLEGIAHGVAPVERNCKRFSASNSFSNYWYSSVRGSRASSLQLRQKNSCSIDNSAFLLLRYS
jgi:hypothetical protein